MTSNKHNVVSTYIHTYVCTYMQDYIIGELRNPNQWFVHCILPHHPHKLPHALAGRDIDRSSVYGRLDVPLVSAQLKRSDIVKAARLYKQGVYVHTYIALFWLFCL